jgi:hypothetical protein
MGGAATDAKPLIPHAQGTRDGLAPEIRLIPLGKGIPIRNASGDTRRIVTTIRAPVGHAAAAANRAGSTKAYKQSGQHEGVHGAQGADPHDGRGDCLSGKAKEPTTEQASESAEDEKGAHDSAGGQDRIAKEVGEPDNEKHLQGHVREAEEEEVQPRREPPALRARPLSSAKDERKKDQHASHEHDLGEDRDNRYVSELELPEPDVTEGLP